MDLLFYFWLCLGCILIIADLLMTTAWLFLLGLSCLLVSVLVYTNITVTLTGQCLVFCLLSLIFCIGNAVWRLGRKKDMHQSDPLDNIDVGQEVVVKEVPQDRPTVNVFYRGINWQAKAEDNCTLSPGIWIISGRDGNVLRIKPKSNTSS